MASTSNGTAGVKGKLELMHLVEQLKLQKRTGWVRNDVKSPESIADHMYRMAILSLLSEEDQELDIGKCVQMAVVHDLAEASVGDITPFDGVTKEAKQKLEEVSPGSAQELPVLIRYTGCYAPHHARSPRSSFASFQAHSFALARVRAWSDEGGPLRERSRPHRDGSTGFRVRERSVPNGMPSIDTL